MNLEGHRSAHDRPQVEKESVLTRTVKRGAQATMLRGPSDQGAIFTAGGEHDRG